MLFVELTLLCEKDFQKTVLLSREDGKSDAPFLMGPPEEQRRNFPRGLKGRDFLRIYKKELHYLPLGIEEAI